MSKKPRNPVPNRLVSVPPELYRHIDMVLEAEPPEHQRKSMRRIVDIAYRRGYQDGYRDGHTDAENGHDERVHATCS